MFGHSYIYSKEDITAQRELYAPFKDMFKPDIFPTISTWDGNNFLSHIEITFNKVTEYLESLRSKNDSCYISKSLIPHIIEIYKYYPKVIRLGLLGRRVEAYNIFSTQIMSKMGMSLSTFQAMTHHPMKHINDSGIVYRMRVSEEKQLRKDGLFHVPIDKQHLIANFRFSISGLPCFYMGDSAYGCWKEMNEPLLNECHVSMFDMTGHSFINLTRTPEDINRSLNIYFSELENMNSAVEENVRVFEYLLDDYLTLWPLIFCCCVKVQHTNAVFKPEYIFPQLLMEWIINDNRFDGVKFVSTKNGIAESFVNYAIPTREFDDASIYCKEALSKFRLTEPLSLATFIENKNFANKANDPLMVLGEVEVELKKQSLEPFLYS